MIALLLLACQVPLEFDTGTVDTDVVDVVDLAPTTTTTSFAGSAAFDGDVLSIVAPAQPLATTLVGAEHTIELGPAYLVAP